MIIENEEIPDDVYMRTANKKGIDTNRDLALIKADIHWDLLYMQRNWAQCREEYLAYPEEVNSPYSFKHIRESVLTNGGTMKAMKSIWIGGTTPSEVENYVLSKNNDLTFSEFKAHRKKNKTKELLEKLDQLDLEEIRDSYFGIRGNDND